MSASLDEGSEPPSSPEAATPNQRRWPRRVAFLTLGVLAAGLLFGRPLARWIPQTLIERSEPRAADALVVLAGDHRGGRVDAALELWRAGHVPSGPLMVSGGQLYGETTWAELMRARAIKGGVPAERIRLQARSTTTAEDAEFCAKLLALPPGSRVILVTSPWHSERAAKHFREALGEGVEVLSCPSPERQGDWWKSAEDTRALATELLKHLWWGEGG